MTTQELFDLTVDHIVTRIHQSFGLTKFAHRRAKFEGWLKVELIDILVQKGFDALPEVGWIDVSFDKVGIELKTVNTNFRYSDVINTIRPITKNIQDVNQDIKNLRNTDFIDKFVIFIVFPVEHDRKGWEKMFSRITCKLEDYLSEQFTFGNGIPGVIYYGRVL